MKNLPLLHWMEDIDPVLIERADNYRATRLKPYLRVAMIAAAVLLLLTVALTSLTVWRLDTYVRQEYAEEYDGTLLHALDIVLTQDENTVSTLLGEQNKRDLHVLFNALRGVSDDEKQTDSEQTEQEVYSEGLEYRSRGDGNCSVVGIGSCKDIHLIIPKYSPDGELVVDIGEGAFENCVTITKVTIPDSVTQIQEAAFRYCTKLTEITLPENLTYIGDFAFESCWKLTELHIPASVTHIGQGIVGKTLLLESITVAPENTTYHSIENCLIETSSGTLIAGCSTSVIPDGVTSIGAYAFYCCSGLRNLSVPEGVTSIGEYAFLGCNTLTEITFPKTLTSVGMFAFAECSILRSVVFPESMTQIAGMAFQKCEKLESVILPADVDSIGLNVFRECVSLTEIDIPDGWTTIPGRMFQSCWKLERVGIPDSVTKIGVSAFEQCGELRNVHIPDGVTSISDNTFYNCSLTEIHIPEGVTSIGAEAFAGNAFVSVTIPQNVTSIGARAFASCTKMVEIFIPSATVQIGKHAFENCKSLERLTVDPENAEYRSEGNCLISSTGTVLYGNQLSTIPTSVNSIGAESFWMCDELKSIVIPQGVIVIRDQAFVLCENLESVIISDSVTHIEYHAFHQCNALTDVYYTGTKQQWEAIEIIDNEELISQAQIHFNYDPEAAS